MMQRWLVKEGKKSCVIFYNGWGMDDRAVAHLGTAELDIYLCSHYSSADDLQDEFSDYESVFIVAWSLGVYVAEQTVATNILHNLKGSLAINGTPDPYHDEFGIPKRNFDTTLITWDEKNRKKFSMRMFGGRNKYEASIDRLPDRTPEEQKKSLESILDSIKHKPFGSIDWNKALCGTEDLIFPFANQVNCWNSKAVVIDGMPHYPFHHFTRWDQLIAYFNEAE